MPPSEEPSIFAYHLLKCALGAFAQPPAALDASALARARDMARKTLAIEDLVLSSVPADFVRARPGAVAGALQDVQARYAGRADFLRVLADNALNEDMLATALRRELRFDAILARIAERTPPVTAREIAAYYDANPNLFHMPETRTARHILVTVNPDYPENAAPAARRRIDTIRGGLGDGLTAFAAAAQAHSECPSALEGGILGRVARGQLYRELDAVLFVLDAGEISAVVQSELGYHIVLCEDIHPGRDISLDEAAAAIGEKLTRRRRHGAQRDWIAGLSRTASPTPSLQEIDT
ncbi:nitrogen fixation protein NifM [Varunaivibrio sulfuroxidans]|nr:nitrogen fixation protein NifM [Varunaivibrio sulfuroxidans]WES32046.1 nitrogen fixation protein NifM [Varunaivibrio sulfuroxidans]